MKGRAFVRFAFRPDFPAVPKNDPLDYREPDAGTGKLCLTVQTLEDTEQLIGVVHIEAGSIIVHRIHDPIVPEFRVYFDLRFRFF